MVKGYEQNGTPGSKPRHKRLFCAGLLLALALAPSYSVAQTATPREPSHDTASEDTADTEAARRAFADGIQLAKQERWMDALQAFTRSEALHPHAITTYNMAYCERALRRYVRARKLFARALIQHESQAVGALPDDLIGASQRYVIEADRIIVKVVVTALPAGAAITIDGRPLDLVSGPGQPPVLLAGTRDRGPPEAPPHLPFQIEVDPGNHVFGVSGTDDRVRSTTYSFGPAARANVRLGELSLRPAQRNTQFTARELRGPAPSAGSAQSVPVIVAFAVSGVGLAVGTVSGIVALNKKDRIEDACPDTPSCGEERASGNRAADISTAAFVTAGAAAGSGAVLLFLTPGTPSKRTAARQPSFGIHPVIVPLGLGLRGTM